MHLQKKREQKWRGCNIFAMMLLFGCAFLACDGALRAPHGPQMGLGAYTWDGVGTTPFDALQGEVSWLCDDGWY